MSEETLDTEALLVSAAARYDLDVAVLKQLLALETKFPDFSQFGSKTQFSRAVASVLDGSMGANS